MALAHSPRIITDGLVLCLDAGNTKSYPIKNFVQAKIYSVYGGGLRSANYSVQYSDDNSTWTTAFSGIASNNSSCGIQVNTGAGNGSYGAHRYWRYVEGSAIVNHHPRVSRIILTDIKGVDYDYKVYTADNCSDVGDYILGTVTPFDFGGTTWTDLSGQGNNGILTNGPTYSSSNGGSIVFDGSNDYVSISSGISYSEYTIMFFCRWISSVGVSERIFGSDAFGTYTIFNPSDVGFHYNPLGGSPPTVTLSSGVNIGFGTWCQVAVTVSASNTIVRIYVNGVLRNSSSILPSQNLVGNLFIGSQNTLYRSNCNVSNFNLYNRALTASEIQQNFNALRGRYGI